MTSTCLYWITRLNYLKGCFCFIEVVATAVALTLAVATVIGYCEWVSHEKKYREELDETAWPYLRKLLFITLGVLVATGIADVLTPSTKEVAVIYAVPKMMDGETMDNLGEFGKNMSRLAVDWSREMAKGCTTNEVVITK